jgi:hypothetical protein
VRVDVEDGLVLRWGAADEEAVAVAVVSWFGLAFLRVDLRFTDSDGVASWVLGMASSAGPRKDC